MFWRAKPKPHVETEPSLPSDVKFALKHRDARLTAANIAGLFDNGLGHLGFYMAMKASDSNHSIQASLLARAAQHSFDLSRLTRADATDALDHLASQDTPHVEGWKLCPVNSIGLGYWKARFGHTLGQALESRPEAPLFMVANAPYVGMDELAAHSLRRGRALGILKPSRFDQADGPVGFMLEPGSSGVGIDALSPDFERPEDAIVFDDALHTGDVRARVLQFWDRPEPPSFIAAFVDKAAVPN